jgi:hypothetical protein
MTAGASSEFFESRGVIRHPSLAAARAAIMAEADYVQKTKGKDGKGPGYTFASEAAIVGLMHEACAKHGVLIAPTSVEIVEREQYESRGGGRMTRTVLRVTYTIRHAFSADVDTAQAMGEAADVGDKSIPKAMTIAYKYALRQLNMLETGDDPDDVASEHVAPAPRAAQPPASRPPAPRTNPSSPPNGARTVYERLLAFEAAAVAQGKIEDGELVDAAVANFGALLGDDPRRWADGCAGDVAAWARSYVKRAQEVANV